MRVRRERRKRRVRIRSRRRLRVRRGEIRENSIRFKHIYTLIQRKEGQDGMELRPKENEESITGCIRISGEGERERG